MNDSTAPAASLSTKKPSNPPRVGEKGHRIAKRRAPKACQCCRARKVRCNVTESGAPCMNCRLDEVECIVTESKRKRRCLPKVDEEPHNSSPSKCTKRAHDHPPRAPAKPSQTVPSSSAPICRIGPPLPGEHVPHSLYQTISERLASVSQLTTTPQWPGHRTSTTSTSSTWSAAAPNTSLLSHFKPTLPSLEPFLKPIPPRTGLDELMFLQRKMVTSVPPIGLRMEILRAYVDFVHPLMPMLELDDFLRVVETTDGSCGKTSLLLFHAVLFAGSLHVDESSFLQAGFTSRDEARSSFFSKARALYEMDYESDRLIQVQALLLMSSWHDKPDERKDGSYWTGLAITTAYAIGLDREPGRLSIDPQQQRHCKRLWWCLVMRELVLSLELRRLPRIRIDECEVPHLEMDDFNINVPLDKSAGNTKLLKAFSDLKMRRFTANACIQRLKLCLCIGHILKLQLFPRSHKGPRLDMDSIVAVAEESNPVTSYLDKVAQCRTNLHEWYQGLAEELQLDGASAEFPAPDTVDRPMALQRLCLHMMHFAALSILHISKMAHGQLMPPTDSEWHDIFQQVVQLSSLRLAEVARTLLHLDLVQHLPSNVVAILFRSATVHLQLIHSTTDARRSNHLQSFVQCVRALYRLQANYPSAEQSLTLIETAARRAAPRTPQHGTADQKTSSSVMQLICEAVRNNLVTATPSPQTVTPPPEDSEPTSASVDFATPFPFHDATSTADATNAFTTFTPPSSRGSVDTGDCCFGAEDEGLEDEFESFVNIDDVFDEFTEMEHGALKFEDGSPGAEEFVEAGLMDLGLGMGADALVV